MKIRVAVNCFNHANLCPFGLVLNWLPQGIAKGVAQLLLTQDSAIAGSAIEFA